MYLYNGLFLYFQGVLKCQVFKRVCDSEICYLEYNGKGNGIFFWSAVTGAGDEMGWDFLSAVRAFKTSFTGFCNELSRKYKTTHAEACPFMSVATFVKWFFNWLASFNIDFRTEIDPWCKYDPMYLACDGTHIGVSVRQLNLPHPVTATEDKKSCFTPGHKRYDRVLIPYPEKGSVSDAREARYFLKYFCRKLLNRLDEVDEEEALRRKKNKRKKKKTKDKEPLTWPVEVEEQKKEIFKKEVQNLDTTVCAFLLAFADRALPPDVMTAAAKFLLIICGDNPLSAALPPPDHQHLLDTCSGLMKGQYNLRKLEEVKYYGIEISNLLKAAFKNDSTDFVCLFLVGLCMQVVATHQKDKKSSPPQPMGEYNPPEGTCYYFTEHGRPLREQPYYNIPGEAKGYKIDDPCQKNFPKVSYGGFGYMMLFFCPLHGHCYGYHLIAGGEGRKDVFSALYKYKPTAPKNLYFDFACQLSEYCLNREPEFFKFCKFWHDIFHSVTHLCGSAFKSTRVLGMEGVNTEICEQFNAFLQCIKYTGSHLSQNHFTLFAQFMIYIWNKEKTQKFKNFATVAISGMQ
jgi:hypothetical protein